MLYAGSGSPIPNDTMGQFRASDEDWKLLRKDGGCFWDRIIRELCDRVAALEAAPDRVLVRSQTGEYLRAGTPVYLADPAPEVPTPEPTPELEPIPSPAADGGLVEVVIRALQEPCLGWDEASRNGIRAVARWLRGKDCPTAASLLEREANR